MGFVLFIDVDQHRSERLSRRGVVDQTRMEATHTHGLDQVDHCLARCLLVASDQHIAGNIHIGLQMRRRHIL